MVIRFMSTCSVLLMVAACRGGDPTSAPFIRTQYAADGSGPTMLVTNSSCTPGPCVPFDVRGFVPKFAVPGQPPSGFLLLGSVNSASVCLRIPSSVTLTVTEPEGTTITTWTPDDAIVLSAVRSLTTSLGSTGAFTPSGAAGWAVTFPSEAGSAGLTAAASPCLP
jgi:hypothetical protein